MTVEQIAESGWTSATIKRGQHYSALGESFIIFICTFDRFKQGRHIYTFQERCTEDTNLLLNDGATKIFLNTKARHDFKTLQMALLESKMEGEELGRTQEREAVAVKMLRKGKTFEEVREFTDLSIQRIEQLSKVETHVD